MPKCPKCHEVITHLMEYSKAWEVCRFALDSEGDGQYSKVEEVVSDEVGEDEYECPMCATVLFTEHTNAEAFLRGATNA